MLGMVQVSRGHWEKAELHMTEALAIQRAIGIQGYGAWALAALSTIAHRRGDTVTSTRRATEALAMFRAIDHTSGAAVALCTLAGLAAEKGNGREELAAYKDALGLWAGTGDRGTIAWAFSGLAAMAAAWDQPELAATLVGVVDARLEESGADLWQGDRRLYEQSAATARSALGEERFAILVSAGRELPLAPAVAAASEVAIPDPLVSSSSPSPAAPSASTLVTREQHAH
jgi:hypothetical protein